MEYGYKRDKRHGCFRAYEIKKANNRNRNQLSDLFAAFCTGRVLRKLEMSRYAENLVLKGGMFLYVISNFEGRPTMDIDFMLRRMSNDVTEIEAIIEEICRVDTHNDFIDMEVLGTKVIAQEKKYPGMGINLMAHIKNVRIPFSIDIGVDDVIVPSAVKRTVATRLAGFKEPSVYTYSLESTIAEKFDAILKRMTASSRMKDFYDIYYWSQIFDFDGRTLQEAIWVTLQHRGTPYERDSLEKIKAFDQNKFLQNLWNNYNPGPRLEKPDFSAVLAQINRFIEPLYEAILKEDEFSGTWSAKENVWKMRIK
ncbi:MAG: nucleotidyl transferase AbiEii/AbiGii toxin family protein [Lachnospiraceae bacterium]|nr:nucleotidyl transferase AbiEii/AbiGii toxin family protein [Lachnospiraceae bacterium]